MFNFGGKNSEVEIIEAEKGDLKSFRDMFFEYQQHHFKAKSDFFINPKRIDIDLNSYLETISEPNRKVFFAKIGNLAVGMLMITILEVPVGDLQYPRSRPTIEMVVTKPKYRKKGIAQKLLDAAYNWAKQKGYHEVVCDIWSFSTDALAFFEKQGFTVRTSRYYKSIK